MRRLILVTSPPACGKTFISKEVSKALKPIVYLDKDTLIGLSNQIFKVANEENNRSSDFFEEHIRNTEYEVVIDLALEALDYCDTVLINAPFTREIRDLEYMDNFRNKLKEKEFTLSHDKRIIKDFIRCFKKYRNLDELNEKILEELIEVIYVKSDKSIEIIYLNNDVYEMIRNFSKEISNGEK